MEAEGCSWVLSICLPIYQRGSPKCVLPLNVCKKTMKHHKINHYKCLLSRRGFKLLFFKSESDFYFQSNKRYIRSWLVHSPSARFLHYGTLAYGYGSEFLFLNTLAPKEFGLFCFVMLKQRTWKYKVNAWIVLCELAVTQIIGIQNWTLDRKTETTSGFRRRNELTASAKKLLHYRRSVGHFSSYRL